MLDVGVYLTLEPMEIMEKKEEYRCRVTDIEPGKLYIDYPINMETNRTVYLLDGMQVSASFIDPKSSSAVYLFQTEVLGRERKNIPMLILHDPGIQEYMRIQRRKFVRVNTPVNVAVHREGNPPFATSTEDLSAGGLAVAIPRQTQLSKGESCLLFLSIPMQSGEQFYLEVEGKVVRVYEDEKSEKQIASIQFMNIQSADQQVLMKFCFERQLALKRKGLI